jgi:predicted RNase H-like HicB family nuclease
MSFTQELRPIGQAFFVGAEMQNVSPAKECVAVLVPDEDDGGFCAYLANLKGVHSEGETLSEALENIREAAQATIARYIEKNLSIPWQDVSDLPVGATVRRILVNA